MSNDPQPHIRVELDGGVAIARVLSREVRHPEPAQELGAEVASLVDRGYPRILLNFADNRYLCSTAFAALLTAARKAQAAGGQVRISDMDPDVLVGAQIIGLGRLIPIHATEREALAAF